MSLCDRDWAKSMSGVVFFDRRLVDAAAALEHATGYPTLKIYSGERYNTRVFMTPPWPEIYVNDADRQHGLQEGIDEYERLLVAFSSLGYTAEVLPKIGVAQRADIIIECLGLAWPTQKQTVSNPPDSAIQSATRQWPVWVKVRRTHSEHLFSALTPIAAGSEPCQHLRSEPIADISVPCARRQRSERKRVHSISKEKGGPKPPKHKVSRGIPAPPHVHQLSDIGVCQSLITAARIANGNWQSPIEIDCIEHI